MVRNRFEIYIEKGGVYSQEPCVASYVFNLFLRSLVSFYWIGPINVPAVNNTS